MNVLRLHTLRSAYQSVTGLFPILPGRINLQTTSQHRQGWLCSQTSTLLDNSQVKKTLDDGYFNVAQLSKEIPYYREFLMNEIVVQHDISPELQRVVAKKSLSEVVVQAQLLATAGIKLPQKIYTVEEMQIDKDFAMLNYCQDSLKFASIVDHDGLSSVTMKMRYNQLQMTIGHFVSRISSKRMLPNRKIPFTLEYLGKEDLKFVEELESMALQNLRLSQDCKFDQVLNNVMNFLEKTNNLLIRSQPWKNQSKQSFSMIYITSEALRICSLLLRPVMPVAMTKLLKHLATEETELKFVQEYRQLKNHQIILFPKLSRIAH